MSTFVWPLSVCRKKNTVSIEDFLYFFLSFRGETPLHIAIVYNDLASVELLIKHGVDVNQRIIDDSNLSLSRRRRSEHRQSKIFQRKFNQKKQFDMKLANPESKIIRLQTISINAAFRSFEFTKSDDVESCIQFIGWFPGQVIRYCIRSYDWMQYVWRAMKYR